MLRSSNELTTLHLGVHDQCLESVKQSRATLLHCWLHFTCTMYQVNEQKKVAPCNYYNLQLTLLPEDPLGDLAPAAVQKKICVSEKYAIIHECVHKSRTNYIMTNRLSPTYLKTSIPLRDKNTCLLTLGTRIWCLTKKTSSVNDIPFSHFLSALQCIDNVRRNTIVITFGSHKVNHPHLHLGLCPFT